MKQRAKPSTSCQRFLRSKGYDRARFGRVASRSGKDASLEEADLTAFVIIWGGDLSYANLFEQRDLKDQDLGGCASWRRSSPVATSRGRTSGSKPGGSGPLRLDLRGAKLDIEGAVLPARCLGDEVDGLAIRRAQPSTRGAVH